MTRGQKKRQGCGGSTVRYRIRYMDASTCPELDSDFEVRMQRSRHTNRETTEINAG